MKTSFNDRKSTNGYIGMCVPNHMVLIGKGLFKEIQIQSNSDLSDSNILLSCSLLILQYIPIEVNDNLQLNPMWKYMVATELFSFV